MKPEWCPQDIWDEAHATEAGYPERGGWAPTPWSVERLARAIMAAEKRGEEAAQAKMAALLKDPAAVRVNYLRGDIACHDLIREGEEREREACEQVILGYPPEGFNAALYERTDRHDEHDPFWKFEGDTGNWAALMGEVLKPYAAAIRNRGKP